MHHWINFHRWVPFRMCLTLECWERSSGDKIKIAWIRSYPTMIRQFPSKIFSKNSLRFKRKNHLSKEFNPNLLWKLSPNQQLMIYTRITNCLLVPSERRTLWKPISSHLEIIQGITKIFSITAILACLM